LEGVTTQICDPHYDSAGHYWRLPFGIKKTVLSYTLNYLQQGVKFPNQKNTILF